MKFSQTLGIVGGLATILTLGSIGDSQAQTARAQKLQNNLSPPTELNDRQNQKNHHTYNLQRLTIQYDHGTGNVIRMEAYGWKENEDQSIDHLALNLSAQTNGAIGTAKANPSIHFTQIDFQDPQGANEGINRTADISFKIEEHVLGNKNQPAFQLTRQAAVGAQNSASPEKIDVLEFIGNGIELILLDRNGRPAKEPAFDANALENNTRIYGLVLTQFDGKLSTQYENNRLGTLPGFIKPAPRIF